MLCLYNYYPLITSLKRKYFKEELEGIREVKLKSQKEKDSKIDPLSTKRLSYLNLEYNFKERSIISLDKYKFVCHFEKGFQHILHGDSKQLNSITDLIINLGISLEQYNNSTVRTLEVFSRSIESKNKTLKQLVENLDFVKNQNESILHSLVNLKGNLPSKVVINELKFLLETNKPKVIELESKRILEDLKTRTLEFDDKIKQVEKVLTEVRHIVSG